MKKDYIEVPVLYAIADGLLAMWTRRKAANVPSRVFCFWDMRQESILKFIIDSQIYHLYIDIYVYILQAH
jgi:hypothetical protein